MCVLHLSQQLRLDSQGAHRGVSDLRRKCLERTVLVIDCLVTTKLCEEKSIKLHTFPNIVAAFKLFHLNIIPNIGGIITNMSANAMF